MNHRNRLRLLLALLAAALAVQCFGADPVPVAATAKVAVPPGAMTMLAGCVAMLGATGAAAAFTVRVAALLVTLPALLVTVTV